MRSIFLAVMLVALASSGATATEDSADEGAHISSSSQSYVDGLDAAIADLESKGYKKQMKTPGLGAMSDTEVRGLIDRIKREEPIPGVSNGDKLASYDIILQPGHYKRVTGRTGASGAKVSERAMTGYLVGRIVAALKDSGLKVLVVPADGVTRGLKTKIFLALHADGSTKVCSSGPSFGYPTNEYSQAMTAIGYSLAKGFGYKVKQFMKANFTADETRYYMFDRIDASDLEGILEIGEITCPKVENQLLANSKEVSENIASALKWIVTLHGSE